MLRTCKAWFAAVAALLTVAQLGLLVLLAHI